MHDKTYLSLIKQTIWCSVVHVSTKFHVVARARRPAGHVTGDDAGRGPGAAGPAGFLRGPSQEGAVSVGSTWSAGWEVFVLSSVTRRLLGARHGNGVSERAARRAGPSAPRRHADHLSHTSSDPVLTPSHSAATDNYTRPTRHVAPRVRST